METPFVVLCEHALLEGLGDDVVTVMSAAPEHRVRGALELVRKLLAAEQERARGSG
ncbi:MAG: hypothetical protein Q8Q09_07755 [Deltaproteobacteria bacterium]|nr:hypothetical protein [Deltaproteobacteria bacterium]